MKFIDLFAGIGGFRRGMELAGHKCIGFCEFDKFATASYTSMHLITNEQKKELSKLDLKKRQKEILKDEYRNGEWYAKDIKEVTGDTIPKADCWCFGAPCQSFSIAGKRAGLNGESGLVQEVFRILREIKEENRPEWIIYENVKGMFSSNKGFDYLAILLAMDELGYDPEWQLFNSKDWGVPQNRERVYTIGHLRRCGRRKIFPITKTDGENYIYGVEGEYENKINIIGHRDGYRKNLQTFSPNGITESLDTCGGGGRGYYVGINVIGRTSKNRHIWADIYAKEGIMSILMANDYKSSKQICIKIPPKNINSYNGFNQNGIVHSNKWYIKNSYGSEHSENGLKVALPVLTPDRVNKRQNGRRFKDNGEPAFTLTAQDKHGVGISIDNLKCLFDNSNMKEHPSIYVKLSENCTIYAVWYKKYQCYIAVRRLTPKEYFRLQGWTDDYFEKAEFVNSNSQLYKQAGNGVTVNVVYEIAKQIMVGF